MPQSIMPADQCPPTSTPVLSTISPYHPPCVQHPLSLPSVTDEVSIPPLDPLYVTAGIYAYARKRALSGARMLAFICGCASIVKNLGYLPVFYFQF